MECRGKMWISVSCLHLFQNHGVEYANFEDEYFNFGDQVNDHMNHMMGNVAMIIDILNNL